jgi:hypothetical protein
MCKQEAAPARDALLVGAGVLSMLLRNSCDWLQTILAGRGNSAKDMHQEAAVSEASIACAGVAGRATACTSPHRPWLLL